MRSRMMRVTKPKTRKWKKVQPVECKNNLASASGWDVSHMYEDQIDTGNGTAVLYRNSVIRFFETPEKNKD